MPRNNYPGVLSRETLELVARIIQNEALALRDCHLQKTALTKFNNNFCTINAYKRLDQSGKGYINSLDLVQFFKDNSKVIPEADTYMLLNQYD